MPGALTEYALRLSLEPTELARFQSSPDAAREAMAAANLTVAEQELMLSGDQRRICDALIADSPRMGDPDEVMEMPPDAEPMEMPPNEPMEMPPEVEPPPGFHPMEMHNSANLPRETVVAGTR